MGCFFQVLGLFPWRTATIRNLAETWCITAPDSLHPGKVWENPMKHIEIRGKFGKIPWNTSKSGQSLGKSYETHRNQGTVWENPMKHIKIYQNQIKIQIIMIRWLHFPSLLDVGHCPSLGRLPGATSNSDAAPWPEISWNWRIWSCLCHVVGCHVFNVYVHANRLISWYYIDDYRLYSLLYYRLILPYSSYIWILDGVASNSTDQNIPEQAFRSGIQFQENR